MLRLRRDDFEDEHELAKFAATAGLSLEEFRSQFEYLVADEPPPITLGPVSLRGELSPSASSAFRRARAQAVRQG
jgi:hypothetical protein